MRFTIINRSLLFLFHLKTLAQTKHDIFFLNTMSLQDINDMFIFIELPRILGK